LKAKTVIVPYLISIASNSKQKIGSQLQKWGLGALGVAQVGRRRWPLALDDRKVSHLEGVGHLAAALHESGEAVAHVVVLHRDVRREIQLELVVPRGQRLVTTR